LARLVPKTQPSTQEEDYRANARRIAHLASDIKAENIIGYDVAGLTVIADAFVICTARSEPQMKAISRTIRDGMKEIGESPLHTEGGFKDSWLVLDYGTIIVHIFRGEAREFYDLDGLWADSPRIDLDLDD
jgi:ribosome-associated protein